MNRAEKRKGKDEGREIERESEGMERDGVGGKQESE